MSRQNENPSKLQTDIAKTKNKELRPLSSPIALEGIDLSSFSGDVSNLTSLPPLPTRTLQSPPQSPPRHIRDPSRKLLSGLKGRKGSEPQPRELAQMQQGKEGDYRPGSSGVSKIYHLRNNPGSTPELSLVGSAENVRRASGEDGAPHVPSRPKLSPHHSEDSVSTKRKERTLRNPLARSKSFRRDSDAKSLKSNGKSGSERPQNTAPANPESQDSEILLQAKKDISRAKSKERTASDGAASRSQERIPKAKDQNKFMTGGMNVMAKAKTGGNSLFNRLGKIGRSSSNHEREGLHVPDSEYVLKVINLPLVEQARKTRISKNLASCKDKTEFWMPSLPWRCIDYLNLNCEAEGLYRIPGSGPQVKHWQRRFDAESDVDLLSEEELYDPNNIGSLLKQWLRELPDDIFPADKQKELAQKLAEQDPDYTRQGKPVPQELRDTLSHLSPFNYYLLFAVTCHLSLLLSHQETNRMDLNNLNICIGPCLRMERWLFNYLVGDWRHCWQGCFTEKQALEAEQAHDNGEEYRPTTDSKSMTSKGGSSDDVTPLADERPVYSSGSAISSQPSRSNSHYSDAKSTINREPSPSNQLRENSKPESYKPTGSPPLPNGGKTPDRRTISHHRPKTSDGKKQFGGEGSGSDSSNSTPRLQGLAHGRSRSDLIVTPTKANGEGLKAPERTK